MKRFLPLLLCLSLSIFALARAMKPTDILVSCAQGARQSPMKANTNTFLKHPITEQEPGSNDNDNENTQDPSGNEGEEATGDGDGDAAGDQDAGDDNGADDDAGDNSDDGGSDDGGQ